MVELPPTFGYLRSLTHCKLANNALQSLPNTITQITNLESLEIFPGNETITSPPAEVCSLGIKAIFDYLSNEPDPLQEGWELVDPSPQDEDKLFDMTANNADPYFMQNPDLTPSQIIEEQSMNNAEDSGWLYSVISFPFSTLKSYVWG